MRRKRLLGRRPFLTRAVSGGSAAGFLSGTLGTSGWLPNLAKAMEQTADPSSQQRHCVLLWMSGGPSQIDTFDMKPKHSNGGPVKEVSTSVAGMRFSEHLPKLAKHAGQLAIMRGMSTKEGDHQRGTTVMRTGHMAGGPVNYPAIGCSLAKSLDNPRSQLPSYVTVAPGPFARQSLSPGFLGPKFAATSVNASSASNVGEQLGGYAQLSVNHMQRLPSIDQQRYENRLRLWESMQSEFMRSHQVSNVVAQDTVYRSAFEMIESDAKDAFDLSSEPDIVRQAYGKGTFGQGCLLARRLIERGVPLVEVTLGDGLGWDTHANNTEQVSQLSAQLDSGWATLMTELSDRGLLERTTILWAGEFGRTPKINSNGGRDHFPQAFTCVLAGGGIAGGQCYGETSADGMEVTEGKIDQQDLLATLCQSLGVSPLTENIAEGGRPIAIAEGNVIEEVLS